MREKIEAVLNEIRPILVADGGNIELVDVTPEGVVRVRLQGACHSCPSSMMTLKRGVERLMMEQIPEVVEVVAV
jgi:Fe-S cluster biogenesis protein NfuA